jgi:glycosyltransferase involved in cell wall biosynthesis
MPRPALPPVPRQSYPTIEIIFVENNATDDTAATERRRLASAD